MTRIILICVVLAALAGCGSGAKGTALPVVASTNVYGDIARQIGGSRVAVTSILSDPNADPHLFEPGTKNGLAVAHARVVVQNGLGYDAFMSRLESSAPNDKRQVVTISDVLGIQGHDANPHLWYDVPELPRIATAIEHALAKADPAHAVEYQSGLRSFIRSLAPLQSTVARIRAEHAGAPVAYTEPVPGYLVAAAGLRNLSLSSFTLPIEEGSEPSASAVSAMMTLAAKHRIKILFYNNQAVSPITQRVRAAAKSADVPVIGVAETVPAGLTFQAWQLKQARELLTALDG
jgi:zinc/manganese transport system substrate-binding protein